jgi:hypothetical protein
MAGLGLLLLAWLVLQYAVPMYVESFSMHQEKLNTDANTATSTIPRSNSEEPPSTKSDVEDTSRTRGAERSPVPEEQESQEQVRARVRLEALKNYDKKLRLETGSLSGMLGECGLAVP